MPLELRLNARLGGAVNEGTAGTTKAGIPKARAGKRKPRANRLALAVPRDQSAASVRHPSAQLPAPVVRTCDYGKARAEAPASGEVADTLGLQTKKRWRTAEHEAGAEFSRAPNAELTGRRRMDALPARRSIDSGRLAGTVASRWRSG